MSNADLIKKRIQDGQCPLCDRHIFKEDTVSLVEDINFGTVVVHSLHHIDGVSQLKEEDI